MSTRTERRTVRARSEQPSKVPKREREILAKLYSPPEFKYSRPKTRAECRGGERPCPFVGCRYNMYLDVLKTQSGHEKRSIKLNFPDLEVHEMENSCALDLVEKGPYTLDEVGQFFNVTRERVRQIEFKCLRRLERRGTLKELFELFKDQEPPEGWQPLGWTWTKKQTEEGIIMELVEVVRQLLKVDEKIEELKDKRARLYRRMQILAGEKQTTQPAPALPPAPPKKPRKKKLGEYKPRAGSMADQVLKMVRSHKPGVWVPIKKILEEAGAKTRNEKACVSVALSKMASRGLLDRGLDHEKKGYWRAAQGSG